MGRPFTSLASSLVVASLLQASPAQARTNQEAVAIALHDLAPLSRVSLSDRMFPSIRDDRRLVHVRLAEQARVVLESDADFGERAVAALALAELGLDLGPEALLLGRFDELATGESSERSRVSDSGEIWDLVLGRMATTASVARLLESEGRSFGGSVESRVLGLGLALRFGSPDVAAAALVALRSVPGVGVRREPTRRVAIALAVAALRAGAARERALEALDAVLVGAFAPERDRLLDHIAQRVRLDPNDPLALAGFWDRRLEGVERPAESRFFEARLRRADGGQGSDPADLDEESLRHRSDGDFRWLALQVESDGSARRHLVLDRHFDAQLKARPVRVDLLVPLGDTLFRGGETLGLRLRAEAARCHSDAERERLVALSSRYPEPRLLWAKWRGTVPIPAAGWLRLAGSLQHERTWWDDLEALQDPRLPDTAMERLRVDLFESVLGGESSPRCLEVEPGDGSHRTSRE